MYVFVDTGELWLWIKVHHNCNVAIMMHPTVDISGCVAQMTFLKWGWGVTFRHLNAVHWCP